MKLALSLLAALSFTTGGVLMKYADGARHLPATAGFVALFVTGALLQSFAMRGSELGALYILVLGAEAALAFGLGVWLFGESLTPVKITAVALIVGGITLLRQG